MKPALWFSICFGILLLAALPVSAVSADNLEIAPETISGLTSEATEVLARSVISARPGNIVCRMSANEAALAESPEPTREKVLTGWRAEETSQATEVFLMSFVTAGGIAALRSFVHLHKRRSH